MRKGTIRRKFVFAVCVAALVALLLPTAALAAPTLADSFPAPTDAAFVYNGSVPPIQGQTFTAVAGTVASAKVYMNWNNGLASGNIWAKIYAISGTAGVNGVPTGAPIATSAPVDAATLIAYPGGPVTFTFNSPALLTANTNYMLVIDSDGTEVGLVNTDSNYAGHNMAIYNGGSWGEIFPEFIIPFEVWQNPPVVSTPASSPWSIALAAFAALGLMIAVPSVRRRIASSKI